MLDKPVAFLHGDLHRFRIDHPLFSAKTNRRFENFIRVETYGSPDIHWVRVTVDPAAHSYSASTHRSFLRTLPTAVRNEWFVLPSQARFARPCPPGCSPAPTR